LLVLSIVIGVAVMTWGKSYVENATIGQDVVQPEKTTVLQDLNSRLASGELTKEQYDKIKEVLVTQNS
jgi:uncharacterized membrane protein